MCERFPRHCEFFSLSAYAKDIKSHLRQMRVSQNNVPTESRLILARVGLFHHDGHGMTICPKHRASLGTWWRASLKCQHPLHLCARRNKPERGASLQMSKEIMAKWEVLVPVSVSMNIFTDVFIVHLPTKFNKLFGRGVSLYYVLISFLYNVFLFLNNLHYQISRLFKNPPSYDRRCLFTA